MNSNNDSKGTSWLFLITCKKDFKILSDFDKNDMDFYNRTLLFNSLVVPTKEGHTKVIAFSDRPNRYAEQTPGGIEAFKDYYLQSDFEQSPPNIAFSGYHDDEKREYYSIFNLQSATPDINHPWVKPYQPVFLKEDGGVVFDIDRAIGTEDFPPSGSYSNVSLIIDSSNGYNWKSGTRKLPWIQVKEVIKGEEVTKQLFATKDYLGKTKEYDELKWTCIKG